MKLKNPLLSFSASGSFGGLISFLNIRGSTYAKTKQRRGASTSPAQQVVRDLFSQASVLAKQLTGEEKEYYASLSPNSAACPWWNNFLGSFIWEAFHPVGVTISSIQTCLFYFTYHHGISFPIDAVDLDKTILFDFGSGPLGSHVPSSFATFFLVSPTVVRGLRYDIDNQLFRRIIVIEFDGLPKPVQHKSVSFALDGYKTITIDEVDLSKAFIIPGGSMASSSDFSAAMVLFSFNTSTSVVCQRYNTSLYTICYFDVIEFP